MGNGVNQIPETVNRPYSAFPTDFTQLPTVSFVIPNLADDMHDGGDPAAIINGDKWVNNNMSAYIDWSKTHNSLFILTFDEGEFSPNNQIATIFAGQMVIPGQYSKQIDHFSVLRTIEDMYGLRYACNASTATPITGIWTFPAAVPSDKSSTAENIFTAVPNPSGGDLVIHVAASADGGLRRLEIFDVLGNSVFEKRLSDATESLSLPHLASGTYLAKVSDGKSLQTKKLIVR